MIKKNEMLKYNKIKGNFMDNIIDYLNQTDLNTLSITNLNELLLQIKQEEEIIKKSKLLQSVVAMLHLLL